MQATDHRYFMQATDRLGVRVIYSGSRKGIYRPKVFMNSVIWMISQRLEKTGNSPAYLIKTDNAAKTPYEAVLFEAGIGVSYVRIDAENCAVIMKGTRRDDVLDDLLRLVSDEMPDPMTMHRPTKSKVPLM